MRAAHARSQVRQGAFPTHERGEIAGPEERSTSTLQAGDVDNEIGEAVIEFVNVIEGSHPTDRMQS
jgi:hypothetical protein